MVAVQHFKGIVNILADLVSRFKTVALFHNIDLYDHQHEFSTPFEPLPPVEPVMRMPLEVNEVFIASDIGRLAKTYHKLHD